MSDNFSPMAKRLRASAAALRRMTEESMASDALAPGAAKRFLASAQRIERCADALDASPSHDMPSARAA